jgi:ribosome-associated translation inhibitor RaiA
VVDSRENLLDRAIEEAVHRMQHLLARHKDKLAEKHRRPRALRER